MTDLALRPESEGLRRARTTWERVDLPRRATLAAAGLVVLLVGLLLVFITSNGLALFTASHVALSSVINTVWNPDAGAQTTFGILPFVAGTLGVMLVAAVIATPLSVGLALFMAEVAPNWARSITRPTSRPYRTPA